jgi:hypothetical protein
MGNGVARIDEGWIRHSRAGILAAAPVQIAPAEELMWHRLFINERHRHDMSDVLHLILSRGTSLDWHRLVARTGEHWPLLLAQLITFQYVYPGYRANVPDWVISEFLDRVRTGDDPRIAEPEHTRGPLISRFSFSIDVREWGFVDPSLELIRAARQEPAVKAIAEAPVWDERAGDRSEEPATA